MTLARRIAVLVVLLAAMAAAGWADASAGWVS